MDHVAQPRGGKDVPSWSESASAHPPSKLLGSGLRSPQADVRMQELTRRKLSKHSIAADIVAEDALPGIPASNWNSPASSPTSHARPQSKHKSIDIPRPSNRRSKSYHDDLYPPRPMTSHARMRTRTLEDTQRYTPPTMRAETQTNTTQLYEESASVPQGPIGYPSTVPYNFGGAVPTETPVPAQKKKATATRSRQRSNAKPMEPLIPRAKRIQHLMSITQGRMQGVISYRRSTSSHWHTSFCAIDPTSGKLYKETPKGDQPGGKLFDNLRGCQARCFREDGSKLLILELHSKETPLSLQIHTLDDSELFRWQAAFLCWQPVSGQQVIGPATDCLSLVPLSTKAEPSLSAYERVIRSGHQASIQKVGKLSMFFEGHASRGSVGPNDGEMISAYWMDVSCTIKDNGDFVVTGGDSKTITIAHLSSMTRSAVQRVHSSAYGQEHCIAIVPQHSRFPWNTRRLQPIVLTCSSRDVLEAWFVLLRAFAVVEIYGPSSLPPADTLRSKETLPGLGFTSKSIRCRVERFLKLSVNHFEDKRMDPEEHLGPVTATMRREPPPGYSHEFRIDVYMEGFLRAKTKTKPAMAEVLFIEDFELFHLPATACVMSFKLVQTLRALDSLTSHGSKQTSVTESVRKHSPADSEEQIIGEASVFLEEIYIVRLRNHNILLRDTSGIVVGTLALKPYSERQTILADKEYARCLSDLLHNFDNNLTIEIADRVSGELMKLARVLLNIFQVSRRTVEWLESLAEEEIDGIRKEAPTQRERERYRSRLSSTESVNLVQGERANLMRDINKNAAAEANLLLRGNTLLSKALDYHMQRVGRDYLERTLGQKMRMIIEEDLDLEVDPARASATASLHYNSLRLTSTATEIWALIYRSVQDCPMEMRVILRYIKACAEDKYGDMLRTAPYSAVSGFIFLRFFCPAILNPSLHGLVDEALTPRSSRSCVLLAKSIIGLANQTTFGTKESWMEFMNAFVFEHKLQYRDFIDTLCNVPHAYSRLSIQPSQAAAQSIFTRLPPLAQEGIPALPYLIDSSRAFAALVKLWAEQKSPNVPSGHYDLQRFHHECVRIHNLTEDCFNRAERSDVEGKDFSHEWAVMARRMEERPLEFWDDVAPLVTGLTALPERSVDFDASNNRRKVQTESRPPRPSTSLARTRPDEESRTKSLRGPFRFRSRSRSRPSSRQQQHNSATDEDEEDEDVKDPQMLGAAKLQKERPSTADKQKKPFWRKRIG